MAHSRDPQPPHERRLRLLPPLSPAQAAANLPAVVPLLQPDQPVTPAQDALLTAIAQRARLGDRAARELLWRAFAPRLQPALYRGGRMTWQRAWARRNGRPWELEDLRQEAWLVFADLAESWDGEGSCVPYFTAYFPWRLRNAVRRLGPSRRSAPLAAAMGMAADCLGLQDAERQALLAGITAALSPADAAVLRLWAEGRSLGAIARHLGVSRRTVTRRWQRIRRVTRGVIGDG